MPTSIINGTPLDCTLCTAEICNGTEIPKEAPNHNNWWVKKFCTYNGSVDPFILYFPFILLFMAIVIVLIERAFNSVFRTGLKLDAFYNLLVRESLLEGAKSSSTLSETHEDKPVKFLEVEAKKTTSNILVWIFA